MKLEGDERKLMDARNALQRLLRAAKVAVEDAEKEIQVRPRADALCSSLRMRAPHSCLLWMRSHMSTHKHPFVPPSTRIHNFSPVFGIGHLPGVGSWLLT